MDFFLHMMMGCGDTGGRKPDGEKKKFVAERRGGGL